MSYFLEDIIKNAKLTKTEAMIAEYILKTEDEIYFMTAADIATKLDISDTSVIRLCRALGFSGFSDFQKAMQTHIKKKMKDLSYLPPKTRLLTTLKDDPNGNLTPMILQRTIEHLNRACINNNSEKIDKIVEILLSSKNRFFYGHRGVSSFTIFLGKKLRLILTDVRIITTGDNEVVEELADITADDCLTVCSFPRYNRMAMTAIEIASKAGAKIITITDKVTAPVAKKADVVLTAEVDIVGFSNSYVVPMFLSDLILVNLAKKINVEENTKLSIIEEYIQANEVNYI